MPVMDHKERLEWENFEIKMHLEKAISDIKGPNLKVTHIEIERPTHSDDVEVKIILKPMRNSEV